MDSIRHDLVVSIDTTSNFACGVEAYTTLDKGQNQFADRSVAKQRKVLLALPRLLVVLGAVDESAVWIVLQR